MSLALEDISRPRGKNDYVVSVEIILWRSKAFLNRPIVYIIDRSFSRIQFTLKLISLDLFSNQTPSQSCMTVYDSLKTQPATITGKFGVIATRGRNSDKPEPRTKSSKVLPTPQTSSRSLASSSHELSFCHVNKTRQTWSKQTAEKGVLSGAGGGTPRLWAWSPADPRIEGLEAIIARSRQGESLSQVFHWSAVRQTWSRQVYFAEVLRDSGTAISCSRNYILKPPGNPIELARVPNPDRRAAGCLNAKQGRLINFLKQWVVSLRLTPKSHLLYFNTGDVA